MANEARKYQITALTPVHIGTGQTFQAGLDFYMEPANQVNKIDLDRMLDVCTAAGIDPLPYVEEGSFGPLLSRSDRPSGAAPEIDPRLAPLQKLQALVATPPPVPKSFDPSPAVAYRAHLQCVNRPETILEQMKTVSWLGYIPGSSIKGAIRTALWAHMLQDKTYRDQVEFAVRQQGEREKKEWAAQVATKAIFGKDPNHDLGRTIQVGDALPGAKATKLGVCEVLVADLDRQGKLQWKNLSSHRLENKPQEATSLFCECLPQGSKLEVEIRINTALFTQENFSANIHREITEGFNRHRELIVDFEEVCSAWASELINRETPFFRNGGLGALASFYEDRLTQELNKKDGFLLQVGWGTGWMEKTGGHLLDEGLQSDLRRWFNLGKLVHAGCGGNVRRSGRSYSCFKCDKRDISTQNVEPVAPFPKTRKVVFENGAPAYPMGWLKVERLP